MTPGHRWMLSEWGNLFTDHKGGVETVKFKEDREVSCTYELFFCQCHSCGFLLFVLQSTVDTHQNKNSDS